MLKLKKLNKTCEFLYVRADKALVVRFANGMEVGLSADCFENLTDEFRQMVAA